MVARKKPKKASTGDTIRERPESVRAKKLPNIYLRDKIYIPTRFVDEDVVIRQYTHCEFDDNVCRTCDLRSARPCNDCYECQWGGLKGTFLMAGHKVVSGRPYYTVPLGDIDNVEYKLGIDFDDFNLVDKTTRKKFAYPIKYTGQLYDYQEAPVRNILKYKMGILKSKPRTGKCVDGEEVVEVNGILSTMRQWWSTLGNDTDESVNVAHLGLTTRTAYGVEPITWIHRKRSKTIQLYTNCLGRSFSLRATPEHPVFRVETGLPEVRMDGVKVGDCLAICTKYLDYATPHGGQGAAFNQVTELNVGVVSGSGVFCFDTEYGHVKGISSAIVTGIDYHDDDWVYDLTVEGSHTFIASGFMVHNTVMATAAICKYGQRAIIMADQKDFLDGFLETFHAVTNVLQLEEECGHKLVGFPKTLKDFDTLQVILITYQQLIKNTKAAKDKLRKLRTLYGVLCVDEVHRTCAPQFSRILGLMTTRMRFGLSATPHRKDKRENLAFHMIGPVIAKTKAEALKPKIAVHYTPDTVKSRNQFSGQAGWTRFCQFLAKHEDRNMMIVDQAIKDLKKGRNIVIPIMFTEHAEKLKREINAAYGEEIAEVFLGGSKHAKFRKQIVDDARAGKIRVVIGIRRLVQIGINVPQWDTLYYVKPLNNAPNWEQESYRILTPLPDKQPPLIRMFVDRNMNRSLGCFKSTLQTSLEFGHELLPKSKERLRDDYGSAIYDVSAKAKKSVKTGRDSSGVLGRTF